MTKPKGNTKIQPKKENLEKTTTTIRHNFSPAEITEKAQLLGEAVQELRKIEDELSSIKSDYKKKLTERQANIQELSNHITQKYEMQLTPCFLRKDYKLKERQYLSHDSEVLKTEPLTADDYQLAIDEVGEKE